MKISKHADEKVAEFDKKILDTLGIEAYQGIFNTLLGCSNNICRYIIEEKNIISLPVGVRYSMLQIHSMMDALAAILQGKQGVEIGGHLPVNEEAWNSEEDFEKRFILLVKLFHKALKEEGKL